MRRRRSRGGACLAGVPLCNGQVPGEKPAASRHPASGACRGRLAGCRLVKMQRLDHEAEGRAGIRADKHPEFSPLLPFRIQHLASHGRQLAKGFDSPGSDAQAVAAPSPPLPENPCAAGLAAGCLASLGRKDAAVLRQACQGGRLAEAVAGCPAGVFHADPGVESVRHPGKARWEEGASALRKARPAGRVKGRLVEHFVRQPVEVRQASRHGCVKGMGEQVLD